MRLSHPSFSVRRRRLRWSRRGMFGSTAALGVVAAVLGGWSSTSAKTEIGVVSSPSSGAVSEGFATSEDQPANQRFATAATTVPSAGLIAGTDGKLAKERTGTVTNRRDIIRTAQLSVEVRNINTALKQAARAVRRLGGYTASAQTDFGDGQPGEGSANLVYRVPPNALDGLLDAVGAIGRVRSRQIGAADVTWAPHRMGRLGERRLRGGYRGRSSAAMARPACSPGFALGGPPAPNREAASPQPVGRRGIGSGRASWNSERH